MKVDSKASGRKLSNFRKTDSKVNTNGQLSNRHTHMLEHVRAMFNQDSSLHCVLFALFGWQQAPVSGSPKVTHKVTLC